MSTPGSTIASRDRQRAKASRFAFAVLLILLVPLAPFAEAAPTSPTGPGGAPGAWNAEKVGAGSSAPVVAPDVEGTLPPSGIAPTLGYPAAARFAEIPLLPPPSDPHPDTLLAKVLGILGERPPLPGEPTMSPDSASLGTSFVAATDNGAVPPDTQGAVGPSHVITLVNGEVKVQTRAGAAVSSQTQDAFWQLTGIFDPRARYDPYGNRFIVTALSGGHTTSSQFLVGASTSSDPTTGFVTYGFTADGSGNCWADYDTVGFNKDWIVVSAALLGGVPGRTCAGGRQIWAVQKSQVYAGQSASYWWWHVDGACTGGCDDPFVPATTFSSTLATVYLVNEHNRDAGELRIRTITGPTSAPVLSSPVTVSPGATWGNPTWGNPVRAPQSGTTVTINGGGTKLDSVVYRNGALWAAQTVGLPASAPTRSAAQWWQLDPAGSVTQFGRVDDTSGNFRVFPSIAVNSNSDVLLGYSVSSSSIFPSAAYAWRHAGDTLGAMHQIDVIYKSGEGAYKGGGTSPYFGDYSGTVVDPVNDVSMWTIQEYGWGTTDHWGTYWGQVVFTAPPSNDNFASSFLASSVPYTSTQATAGATTETGEPMSCVATWGSSVWYRYAPSASGTITIDTSGSSFDTILAAYTGSAVGSLTQVPGACNDDFSGLGLQSQISFPATAGTTYRIQASGYGASGGATGSLAIHVNCSPNNCVPSGNQAPSAPSLSCSPNPSPTNSGVACYFSSTDADSSGVYYTLDWGDGLVSTIPFSGTASPGTTQSIAHGYSNPGTFTISVRATDNGSPPATSASTTQSETITAPANQAPGAPSLSCSPNPSPTNSGVACYFSSTDADSSGVFYTVDWGDGLVSRVPASGTVSPGTTQSIAKGYSSPGTFTISVTATDNGSPPATSAATTRSETITAPTAPGAPQALTASAGPGAGQIALGWSAPASNGGSAITGYKVYRATTSGGPYSLLTTLGAVLSYTDSGLGNGATRYYVVSAVNAVGEGPQGGQAGATTFVPPSAPQSLSATAGPGAGQIALSWSAPASNGGLAVTNYKVYRSTTSGGPYSLVTTLGNVLSYTDSGLGNGATRYYVVSAVNGAGEGPQGGQSGATTWTTPSAPQSPTASAGPAAGQIQVAWSAPASNGGTAVTGYKVYRATTSGGPYSLVATLGNVLSYSDTGLGNGATRYYVITAVNAAGEGPQSAQAGATTFAPPSAPRSLTAAPGTSVQQIKLTWLAPSSSGGTPVTGYKVYRATTSGGPYTRIATLGNQLSYTDSSLTPLTTYFYVVTALNLAGEGPNSNEACAKPYPSPGGC